MPGLVDLRDARAKAAAVLDAAFTTLDPVPTVHADPLDAVQPPCVRLSWAEPWIEAWGQTPTGGARLRCECIAGRFEPGSGYEEIEDLVAHTIAAFTADRYPWPVMYVGAPRAWEAGGVTYLSTQVVVRLPVGAS